MTEKDYYTEQEVADLLGISAFTTAKLRKEGTIPAEFVVSGVKPISYYSCEIDEWIATGQAPKFRTRAKSEKVAKQEPEPDYEDTPYTEDGFIREFWACENRAVDVIMLSEVISSHVISYVNDALKYAFERFGSPVDAEEVVEETFC